MATSGTYTYNPTISNIIHRACRICRVLRYGQVISNEHQAAAKDALNSLQKAWAADGIHLWTYTQKILSLTASSQVTNGGTNYKCVLGNTGAATNEPGTGATADMYWIEGGDGSDGAWALAGVYTCINELSFDAEVLGLEYVFVRRDGTDQSYLNLITKQEYDSIAIKHTDGTPYSAYFDYGNSKKLWLYPMPGDATDLVIAQVMLKTMDAGSGTTTSNFPPHWLDALHYGLADNLCDEYGVLTPADKSRIRAKAKEFKAIARKLERSTTNGPSNFVCGAF